MIKPFSSVFNNSFRFVLSNYYSTKQYYYDNGSKLFPPLFFLILAPNKKRPITIIIVAARFLTQNRKLLTDRYLPLLLRITKPSKTHGTKTAHRPNTCTRQWFRLVFTASFQLFRTIFEPTSGGDSSDTDHPGGSTSRQGSRPSKESSKRCSATHSESRVYIIRTNAAGTNIIRNENYDEATTRRYLGRDVYLERSDVRGRLPVLSSTVRGGPPHVVGHRSFCHFFVAGRLPTIDDHRCGRGQSDENRDRPAHGIRTTRWLTPAKDCNRFECVLQ